MLLQGNLPLEFKENGTLHGRFLEGNLKLRRWLLKERIEKKKKEKKKGNRRIFLFGNKFRSWRVIHIYRRKDGGKGIQRIFCGEAQRKQEKSNCNQGRSGMFLDVLEIITYAWFLHVFHFWIFNVLLIGVDAKGHKFFLVDIGCWCVRLKPVCDPRH